MILARQSRRGKLNKNRQQKELAYPLSDTKPHPKRHARAGQSTRCGKTGADRSLGYLPIGIVPADRGSSSFGKPRNDRNQNVELGYFKRKPGE
jgi:hypothetical protein